jgi:hypothetical protein
MDATRPRLSFQPAHVTDRLQWGFGLALAAAAIVVLSLLVRELRFAPSFDAAGESSSSPAVPREAVSVPTLVLAAGHQVRVGEPRVDAMAQLATLKLLKRTEEHSALGAREVRAYEGVTFVFEPFERAGDSRVAAIYLQ